ncbi:hypothetical protein BGZ54_002985 [Gamsiella multidivaricata]|nr:hypothetical protein BGZ54_002985 [Gamsiella multidivaricata]
MVHSPTSPTYSPETRIILFCSPPVDEARWAIRRKERGMFMDRDKEVTRTYAEACLKIGQEYRDKGRGEDGKKQELHRVDVIDTWGLMMQKVEAGERTLEDYLKDGLHLASEGNNDAQQLVFEEIMKIVRTRYPEYDPETMPMHAPWWGHLDHSHPETDLLICANKPAKS